MKGIFLFLFLFMQNNVANNKPIAEGVQSFVVNDLYLVGQRVLVHLGAQLGQRLLPQSPEQGQRLGTYLTNQLVSWARDRQHASSTPAATITLHKD
jgi:hypothetical protein